MSTLEKKIEDLKELVSRYETKEFLTFLAGILLQMPTRNDNPFLKKLKSPMRQLFFLGQLNLNRNSVEDKIGFSEKEWDEMASLLDEIEMEYFYLIGFPKKGKETQEDVAKIAVTMPTFMNYYFNGPLAYQEQEIERIERLFIDFEPQIVKTFGVTLSEFITFYELMNDTINDNLNLAFRFVNAERWQEFTSKCIAKGLLDPKTWIDEAPDEIYAFVNFMKNPGSFLILNIDKLNYSTLSRDTFEKIVNLFLAHPTPTEQITYYTENIALLNKPLLKISDNEYLPFFLKQYLNACYTLLWDYCLTIDKDRMLKRRDIYVEQKTVVIFKRLFGSEGHFYTNYSIDDGKSEQDLLILYKGNAIVVEVKAASYRAPLRDANKAFDKLKSDFKKNIQYGYEQTARVVRAFQASDRLRIVDDKRKLLYEVPTKRYRLYTIVVTFERFGHIQTNLAEMLTIPDNEDYPWSVALDDLEAFILTLSKRKNRIGAFLSFLQHRKNFHEHLICSDELELCGLFLKNENDFRRQGLMEETLVTMADLTDPIEKAYREGMGFANERYRDRKKDNSAHFFYQNMKNIS